MLMQFVIFIYFVLKLAPKNGSLNVSGQAAFIAQTPWILNQTVQSNILFGLPMNTSRYHKTITVCELTKDLETMKAGDQSEVIFIKIKLERRLES